MNINDLIIESLYDVVDPEVGVNIVDLGLIYDIRYDEGKLELDLTLTSPACPLADVIEEQIIEVTSGLADEVHFNWTFQPPWDVSKISDDGLEQLRALGAYIPTY